ncbi:MAG: class I SAM-dependent methyltransferase [Bacteroidetes bacterium]|nr:class I SAM-dependent methyltransferase [Bacteroidota bacterium]
MEHIDLRKAQGHWVLAKMGKKVLRPGGKELTEKLVQALDIQGDDTVVEFAPGLGFTAQMVLARQPKKYVGVDANEQAVELLQKKLAGQGREIHLGNAAETGLPSRLATKVYGEAMLTMHADHRKGEIVREAYRLLQPGGLYAIHELGLTPGNLSDEKKAEVQRDLAQAIRVNARPLTTSEWRHVLEKEGFVVTYTASNAMHLLEAKRMIDDEGLWRTLRIGWNIVRNRAALQRVLEMHRVFRKHAACMNAVVMVARKPLG